MPKKNKKTKPKDRKAISKRVKKTKKGLLLVRKAGQGHFNARESGKTTRGKRGMRQISKTIQETIKNVTN